MKDIPRLQLLSKFGPKSWKSLVLGTCPKNLYYQKRHLGPLGVKFIFAIKGPTLARSGVGVV